VSLDIGIWNDAVDRDGGLPGELALTNGGALQIHSRSIPLIGRIVRIVILRFRRRIECNRILDSKWANGHRTFGGPSRSWDDRSRIGAASESARYRE
jgi:hypothetical protein